MAEIQHSCGFRPFSKTQHITHITFAPGRAAVLIHQYGRLVCLQDVVAVQLFVEVIIKGRKVTACALDRPVRHVLS